MHINLDSLKSPLISTLISCHTVIFSSHILAIYLTERPPQEWRTYCRLLAYLLPHTAFNLSGVEAHQKSNQIVKGHQ